MDGDGEGNFGPFPAKPPRTWLLLLKNLANRKSPMTYPARVLSMGLTMVVPSYGQLLASSKWA